MKKKKELFDVPGTGEKTDKCYCVNSGHDGVHSVTLFDGDIAGAWVLYEIHTPICTCSYCEDARGQDKGVWTPQGPEHHGWHVFFWKDKGCYHYVRMSLPDWIVFQHHPSCCGFKIPPDWKPDWKDIVRELSESKRPHPKNNACESSGSYRKLWEKEFGPYKKISARMRRHGRYVPGTKQRTTKAETHGKNSVKTRTS